MFRLRCKFDYALYYTYCKQLDYIRSRMFGNYVYPWSEFMQDVNDISVGYKIPESYVYQDLRDIMPAS